MINILNNNNQYEWKTKMSFDQASYLSNMYYIIWQFKVKGSFEQKMEEVYGPQGAWAQLFKRFGKTEYLGTDLLKAREQTGIYITIDRWRSQQSYDKFRKEAAHEYDVLDKACEALTENETKIGIFDCL